MKEREVTETEPLEYNHNREKKGKQHGNNYFSLHLSRRNTCNLPVEQSRAAGENKSSYGIQAG